MVDCHILYGYCPETTKMDMQREGEREKAGHRHDGSHEIRKNWKTKGIEKQSTSVLQIVPRREKSVKMSP